MLVAPLIIPFFLTNEKQVILADLNRWLDIFDWEKKSDKINLLNLLWKNKEFRNLFYFRIKKGNFMAKISANFLNLFYPGCPSLFMDSSCKVGAGLFIQHGFSSIIMADIGENCWINQQVTIGYKDKSGRPKIGNNVRITAGAKVIGDITIGDNVTIGANAVVVKNVPDNCVVVGVPAYIVKKNGLKVKEELV